MLPPSERWTPAELGGRFERLARSGAAAIASCGDAELLAAWGETVERFRDPRSEERRALDGPLARLCGLSPAGLAAGLEAVLGGVARAHASAVFERAAGRRQSSPALVVLAGNVPALAVQPMLPALALRRPLMLKSSSHEPLFAPGFVRALSSRLPALGEGVAAVTWPGGDPALEAPVLARAGVVLAYGGSEAVADLRRRASGRLVDYGPKLSLAVVARDGDPEEAARGLARDVALFDQRGCLSVQAVLVEGEELARRVAGGLASALAALALELPPGPTDPVLAARVQQLRGEAAMRGDLATPAGALAEGTVLIAPPAGLAPSPGLRTVRVHPVSTLEDVPLALEPWRGLLQGAALCGDRAWTLRTSLERLGVTRLAAPGRLQAADAAWHNGGRDPLNVLAEA